MAMEWILNPYIWMGTAALFFLLTTVQLIFLFIASRKTHMIVELKAMAKRKPIALFFHENRYCEWKAVDVEVGIIQDKNYGAFIVNERATYIDKTTKQILIPFDAGIASSLNVHSAKLADDLQYIAKDEEEMGRLRYAIATGAIDENEELKVLRTSINFGAVKNITNALIPHNINAKIEKVIASRLKSYGSVNGMQVALMFAAIFGAILLGALVIKLAFNN